MRRLDIELRSFVSGFPHGAGAQHQQVAGHGGKFGKVLARKGEPTGILRDRGVAEIPGAVLRVERVEVAGAAVEVDEDASSSRVSWSHRAEGGCLRVGVDAQQSGCCGAK